MGPNVLFMCIIALSYHLSVQFLDIDVQEFPENILKIPEIYFLRLVFIFRKFTFSDWFLFPGNLHSQTGFYFLEISLLKGCSLASALLVTEIS
jgi:hypothetical protein